MNDEKLGPAVNAIIWHFEKHYDGNPELTAMDMAVQVFNRCELTAEARQRVLTWLCAVYALERETPQ